MGSQQSMPIGLVDVSSPDYNSDNRKGRASDNPMELDGPLSALPPVRLELPLPTAGGTPTTTTDSGGTPASAETSATAAKPNPANAAAGGATTTTTTTNPSSASGNGSGREGDGAAATLPIELRWGVPPRALRQVVALHEWSFPIGYPAHYYQDLLPGGRLSSLVAYTTADALERATTAAAAAAAAQGRRAQGRRPVLPAAAEVPPDADRVEELRQIEAAVSLAEAEALLAETLTDEEEEEEEKEEREGEHTQAKEKEKEKKKSRAAGAARPAEGGYDVVVGIVVGQLAYARAAETAVRRGGLHTNPSGYVGSFAVLPALRGTGVGTALLAAFCEYVTRRLPLHASTYLHYDRQKVVDMQVQLDERTLALELQRQVAAAAAAAGAAAGDTAEAPPQPSSSPSPPPPPMSAQTSAAQGADDIKGTKEAAAEETKAVDDNRSGDARTVAAAAAVTGSAREAELQLALMPPVPGVTAPRDEDEDGDEDEGGATKMAAGAFALFSEVFFALFPLAGLAAGERGRRAELRRRFGLSEEELAAAEAAEAAQRAARVARAEAAADPVIAVGVGEVWLHCMAADEALLRYYARRGFRLRRVVPDYYEINGAPYDAALLLYVPPPSREGAEGGKAANDGEEEKNAANDAESTASDRTTRFRPSPPPPPHEEGGSSDDNEEAEEDTHSRSSSPAAAAAAAGTNTTTTTDAAAASQSHSHEHNDSAGQTTPRPLLPLTFVSARNYHRVQDVESRGTDFCRAEWRAAELRARDEALAEAAGGGARSATTAARLAVGVGERKRRLRRRSWWQWAEEVSQLLNACFLLGFICYMYYRYRATGIKPWEIFFN